MHEIELDNYEIEINELNPRWDLEIEINQIREDMGLYRILFYYPNKKYQIQVGQHTLNEKRFRKLFKEPEHSIWDMLIPVKNRPVTVRQKIHQLVMQIYNQIIEKVRYQTQ